MNPQPKPVKLEKQKITAKEFREIYGGKIKMSANSKSKVKKTPSANKRFYTSTAWKWFSRFIKLTYSDSQGMVICTTSGAHMSISDKNLHSGHCIKVFDSNNTHMATAFDERNVMPQSYQENRFYGGRPEVMRDKIDKRFGSGTFEALVIKSKGFKKYSDSELKELSDQYRDKVNGLLKSKGINKWWK